MLSRVKLRWAMLIITLQFSFIFLGQCKTNETSVLSQAKKFRQKLNAVNLLMENDFDHGKDIWASTNTECYNQIKILRSANASKETWAQQMLQASSTNTSRFYKINRIDEFKSYYECSSISTKKNDLEIGGRYCKHDLDINVNTGSFIYVTEFTSCYPTGCSENDIENVWKKLETNFTLSQTHNAFEVHGSSICKSTENGFKNLGVIIAVVILIVLICFLLLSTICDVYIRIIKKDGNIKNNYLRILKEFSLYTNSLRILSTKAPQGNLPVISGLRFMSMCWVILQHSYTYYLKYITNPNDIYPWLHSYDSLHFLISGFAVDTFFVLSGFLMSYIFLNQMSKNQKFNPLQYYFHRYIRLTPAVGAILLLTIFIFPLINLGPVWHQSIEEQKNHCSKIWWPMLLYVSNYVETEHVYCQNHLWYLPVEMQLFWISPLILYPLAKKPKIGLVILALCFIVSIITPAVISAINKYSNGLLLGFNQNILDAGINFFMVPYNRAGPWLMGILLGYILVHKKDQIKKTFMVLAWILAVLALGFSFFSYRFYQSKIDLDYNENYFICWEIFYSGFSHHIWGLCVCCIIYVCSFGYGGIVNKFLSLPIFLPLGKISYSVYVIHATILDMIFSSNRVDYYFTNFDIVSKYFSMVIWSLIAGFIFCLLFETPFLVLEKILRGKLTNVPSVQNGVSHVSKSSSTSTDLELKSQSHDDVSTRF
ncbi:hypothetical protein PV327_010863 [Microctonus hyperodae]|uniref:Nose resistant-to-fluoxetine protein N-terminal domain-containing protein n=1 Tax=Microctonus hyperodae TaxID=165561 RepID=A0AA39C8C4_MICHY|nr:hypothetical protein PV327_010863 [Microctonus hyperodae]